MRPCVYRHYGPGDELLYVGMTAHIGKRTHTHESKARWFDEIRKITIDPYDSPEQAAKAEIEAIKELNPKFNVHRFETRKSEREYIEKIEKEYSQYHPLVMEAIKALGSTFAVANGLGISRQALHQWKGNVPELRRYQLAEMIRNAPKDRKFRVGKRRTIREPRNEA